MAALQFWFDFSCPFAYVGSTQVEALAARTGAELDWQPMLLGGVFRAREVPQKLFATLGPAKAKHNMNDIRRTAARFDVPLEMPAGHPLRTVNALRALLIVGPPYAKLAHAFYRAYWVDGIDISTNDGLTKVLSDAGHDAPRILEKTQDPEVKADLKRRTDRAIELGIFGAPSFIVDDQLYYGVDRMPFVERALGGSPERFDPRGKTLAPVDFWYDYSSPFAYLGSEMVDRVLGGAATWKPMLLGAVFKMIDQVQVPLFEMSDAKRRYMQADLHRQAELAGCPIEWPSRFPMNSVLALRVTLQADHPELRHRIFRAYWAEDRDISQPEVIEEICADLGLDGKALVEGAQDPAVKERLRAVTSEAVEAEVFGAPTFVVRPEGRAPSLFWGADRLEAAARFAAGDERLW